MLNAIWGFGKRITNYFLNDLTSYVSRSYRTCFKILIIGVISYVLVRVKHQMMQVIKNGENIAYNKFILNTKYINYNCTHGNTERESCPHK